MIKINLEAWKGLSRNWIEVNPNRDGQSVTNKVKQHANYLFPKTLLWWRIMNRNNS
ncbi:hypothetical protein SIXOD_v1c17140 [Spiroplasma ixodetis Y32]|nr:hypothetical protein SIXOD_v1c17140 [Spiroplasma ixodetis Y32]